MRIVAAGILGLLSMQSYAATTADAAPDASEDSSLEEVVVTAQRRTERLQDVPISVSVFSQATMDAQGTRDIDDIARLTPGLTFTRGAINNNSESSNIAIRGIDSAAGAATTGIYIDDTPIQSRHLSFGTFNAYPQLFDIDRVEVLRGPQGTLFGSGSEGGTLRFITPEPGLDQYSAYARSEAAETAHGNPIEELGLAGGGPIIADTLGFRASVSYRHEGGYVDRVDWQEDKVVDPNANADETKTARVALKWAVNDSVTVTPSVYYQYRHVDDTSSWWSIVPGTVDPTNGQFDNPFKTGNEIASPSTDQFTLSTVKIDWNLGAVRLVSNTSYYKRDQSAISDYAQFDRATFLGTPYAAQGTQAPTQWADTQRNWTEELRLESEDPASRVNWTAGVFYQHAKENTVENVYDPEILAIIGAPPANGYIYQQDPYDSVDKQIAVFGQANVALIDRLKLTLGLRAAKADFTGQAFYDGFVLFGPPVTSVGSETEHPITPKFGLNYQIDADNLVYGTIAKGFRIGGANPQIASTCDLAAYGLKTVPPGFSADSVWSYEVGTKNEFDDRRVLLDASAYIIKWNNIQQNVYLACGFQFTETVYATQAAAQAAAADPSSGLESIARDGDHLPGAPWTVAVFSQLNLPVWATRGYIRADYQYSAKQTSVTAAQNPLDGGSSSAIPSIPSTAFTSLRAGVRWSGFDVSLFSQNLFDTRPKLSQSPDGPNGTPLYQVITWRPRTIGITATYHYQ
jgi:outer membrane receptor protein involved in Fe transport